MSESSPPKPPSTAVQSGPDKAKDKPKDKPRNDKPQSDSSGKNKKQGSGGRIGLTLFMLALVVGAGAGGGYFLWYSLQTARQQLSAVNERLRQQLDAVNQRTDHLDQQVKANQSLTADVQTLKTQQQALEDSITDLRNQHNGDQRIWDVEEIATLLQIANERLHLEKAVAPSLAALEAADHHLQALKNPALLEVRRQLAEDINALRATPKPDISGMALSLDALINGIDRLPIASAALQPQASETTGAKEKGWRGVLHDLWEKLRSLVSIHHQGESDRPLLAPEQRYFLRQNLRLDLEAARIALLRRDAQTYRQTLGSAQKWIARYFDNEAAPTAGALQELAHLQQTDIAPSLPDISGSLNALQTWLNKRQAAGTAETAQP